MLRGKDAIALQHACRRFPVHGQLGRGVTVSPFREQSSLRTQREISQLSSEAEGYESEQATLLGWSISALLHGLVLAVVAVFNLYVTLPRVMPQKEPFRWDVSLMTAPRTEAVVADGAQSQEAFHAAATYPEEAGERVADSSSQSVASPQPAEIVPAVSSPARKHQRLPALESITTRSEEFSGATAMSVASPAASILPPPEVENPTDSKLVQIAAELEHPAVLQRPQSVTRTLFSKIVLPDYAWLMDTLRTKLERVKTYPALARANHWQGRVVVQVSIGGDGRIANLEIEESSGHPVLDRAALEALQAASPLMLAHGLEGSPVVMLVPLNYQLE